MTTPRDKTNSVKPKEAKGSDVSSFPSRLVKTKLIYPWITAIKHYVIRHYFFLVIASVVGAVVSILFVKPYLIYFLIFAPLSFYYLMRITRITRQALKKAERSPPNGSSLIKGPKSSLPEFERVLSTVFEVVIGLAIFEASLGILSPAFDLGKITISSPLHIIVASPIVFLMYVIFIMTSVQYLMGGTSHLRGKIPDITKGSSFLNFLLLIGQAITILGMSLSVVDRNIVIFSIWYIGLIIMDVIWLGTLITPFHEKQDESGLPSRISGRDIETSNESTTITNATNQEGVGITIYRSIYTYWVNGNFSFLAFLLLAEPLVYIKPTGVLYYEIAIVIELFVMTIISTFYANIKCLELLQE